MSASTVAGFKPSLPRIDPLRALTGVALFSALGMLLGYARDATLAAVFGASALTDAFFVATIIPTIVSTVVMSGALAPSVLPVFRARLDKPAAAWALANTLLSWGGVVLALFVVALVVAAPWLVAWLAPGLDGETSALAIRLTQLGAPLLFLLGLSALMGAFANALGSFRVPALTTVLVNGGALLAILLFGKTVGIAAVVIGLTLGAVIQLVVQTLNLLRRGWRPALFFDWRQPDVQETLRLFLPLIAFVALAQCVPIVERVLGSMFPPGELSLVAYASKLYQIPGLILSGSLAIVLYPLLIQAHADSAQDATRMHWQASLRAGVRASIFLTLPLTVWFWWNAAPLVRLIFQRGAFSVQDTALTAALVQIYMLAVVPAGIVLVLTRALHAQRKMRLTLGIGILTFAVYLASAFVGVRVLGLIGLPFAFLASQIFAGVMLCAITLRRDTVRGLSVDLFKLGLGGMGGALVLLGSLYVLPALGMDPHPIIVVMALLSSLTLMGLVYLALLFWLGIPEARTYWQMLRERLGMARGGVMR